MSEKYNELITRDRMHESDIERKALFYILAMNQSLYDMVDEIYDFKEHAIKPSCLKKAKLTSGTRALIKLGFNLYNNRCKTTVYDSFVYLDQRNTKLALEAIRIRFA